MIPEVRSRRDLLAQASNGFGLLALAGLMAETRADDIVSTVPAHGKPRAKHVILCFMDGGPSHVDTFDHKPELTRQQGKPIGDSQVSNCRKAVRGEFGSEVHGSFRNEDRAVCGSVICFRIRQNSRMSFVLFDRL